MKRIDYLPWYAVWFLCAALFLPPLAQAEQSGAADLASQVQKRYQKVQALSADYTRSSRFVASGGQAASEVKAIGRLYWQRPLSLRMDQAEPKAEQVVTTPQGVWWVRPQRKRADLYPMEQFTTGLQPLMDALGGLAKVDQDFNLEQPTPGETAAAGGPLLVLSPKKKRVDLKRLVLWFDAKEILLKGFRIISLVGDVTEYRLISLQVNPALPKGTFSYTPPAGFQVRDHRPR
jgi:outer membrane lipoprotein carrier protein